MNVVCPSCNKVLKRTEEILKNTNGVGCDYCGHEWTHKLSKNHIYRAELKEIDFEDFQDNACDASQPYRGCIQKIVMTHPERPDRVVCYIVHPDDVGLLETLVQAEKKSS